MRLSRFSVRSMLWRNCSSENVIFCIACWSCSLVIFGICCCNCWSAFCSSVASSCWNNCWSSRYFSIVSLESTFCCCICCVICSTRECTSSNFFCTCWYCFAISSIFFCVCQSGSLFFFKSRLIDSMSSFNFFACSSDCFRSSIERSCSLSTSAKTSSNDGRRRR